MKVLSFYRAQTGCVGTGDVLVTRDRAFMRREDSAKHALSGVCARCTIRHDLCKKGSFLCGTEGYFVDIEPTEEIERARDLLALKGELL